MRKKTYDKIMRENFSLWYSPNHSWIFGWNFHFGVDNNVEANPDNCVGSVICDTPAKLRKIIKKIKEGKI